MIFDFLSRYFGGKVKNEENLEYSDDLNQEESSTNNFALSYEGQLAVDVYQTQSNIVIIAPLAGIQLKDIELTIQDDILTIRGKRENIKDDVPENKYFTQECFWGEFSRSIVLPDNVDISKIKAAFKCCILKISIPFKNEIKLRTIKINSDK